MTEPGYEILDDVFSATECDDIIGDLTEAAA